MASVLLCLGPQFWQLRHKCHPSTGGSLLGNRAIHVGMGYLPHWWWWDGSELAVTLQGEELSSQPVPAEHGAGEMAAVEIKVGAALESVGKWRKPVVLLGDYMNLLPTLPYCCWWWGWKWELEEAQRCGGASLQGAAEWVRTVLQSHGRPERDPEWGWTCSPFQHKSWKLLMKLPHTQQATGNRIEFLNRICKDEMALLYVNSYLCLDCVGDNCHLHLSLQVTHPWICIFYLCKEPHSTVSS